MGLRTLAGLAALCAAACGPAPEAQREPEIALQDCQRLELRDADTGAPIIGAEDIDFHAPSGRLYLAAYDRMAARRALKRGERPPQGGLYALRPPKASRSWPTAAQPVLRPSDWPDGLWPHGFVVGGDADRLAITVINRSFAPSEAGPVERRLPSLAVGRLDGDVDAMSWSPVPSGPVLASEAFCSVNDVAVMGEPVVVTLDRRRCGRGGFWDDMRGHAGGALVRSPNGLEDFKVVASGLAFANGIAAAPPSLMDGDAVLVGLTRGKRLALFADADLAKGNAQPRRTYKLPAAPDNLSIDGGAALVAAHPNLLRLAIHRQGWFGHTAPSEVWRVELETGAARLVLRDPSGRVFSGATSAVRAGDWLAVGSATDAGVLVCPYPALGGDA